MSEMMSKALFFFAVSSLFGGVILFAGIISYRGKRRREDRERTRTTGRIVEYIRKESHSSRTDSIVYYVPVIDFTADGERICREYENRLSPEEHPVGEVLDVLYDISQPEHFHLESDPAYRRGAGNLMLVGFIWIVLAILLTAVLAIFVGGVTIDPGVLRRPPRVASRSGSIIATPTPPPLESDGFLYDVQPNFTAILKGYTGADAELTLPAQLNGHPVTTIASSAFARTMGVTSVTVPGIISDIHAAGFAACLSLTTLRLEEGVKTIGMQAFNMCPSLSDVTLPASLTRISDSAFPSNCKACFHVIRGSEAERYCRKNSFRTELTEPE